MDVVALDVDITEYVFLLVLALGCMTLISPSLSQHFRGNYRFKLRIAVSSCMVLSPLILIHQWHACLLTVLSLFLLPPLPPPGKQRRRRRGRRRRRKKITNNIVSKRPIWCGFRQSSSLPDVISTS